MKRDVGSSLKFSKWKEMLGQMKVFKMKRDVGSSWEFLKLRGMLGQV